VFFLSFLSFFLFVERFGFRFFFPLELTVCVVAMQVVGGGGVTSVFSLPPVAASFRQSSPPPTPTTPSPCSVPPRLLLRLLPPRPAWASSSILHLRCNKKIPLRICCRGQELPSPRRRTRTTTTIGGPELPQTSSSSSSSASSSGLQDLDNWKGDGEGERGFEGERDTSDGEELFQLYGVAPLVLVYSAIAEAGSGGYSQASYYTSLGLFLLSLPGVWSLVKRSTKSKVCLSVESFSFFLFFCIFSKRRRWKDFVCAIEEVSIVL
jgi:hypothetical protein